MDFNITQFIEKAIKDLIKGKRGEQIAKLYNAYWNPINFTIIFLIGIWFNYIFSNILQDFIGIILSNLVMLLWDWIMTVGPLGYIWGFGKKPEKVPKQNKQENKDEEKIDKLQKVPDGGTPI